MILKSYNPIERGQPAIWLDQPIQSRTQVSMLMRQLREYSESADPVGIVIAGGGNCVIGLELYTVLREHPRRKRVTIYSAPSMSGVIAMAGDEIRIAEGGTIFLHHAGYSTDYLLNEAPGRHMPATALKSLARDCETTDALHVQIFARRTGLAPSAIAELRDAETTLNAHEAVRLGFADRIIPTTQEQNSCE